MLVRVLCVAVAGEVEPEAAAIGLAVRDLGESRRSCVRELNHHDRLAGRRVKVLPRSLELEIAAVQLRRPRRVVPDQVVGVARGLHVIDAGTDDLADPALEHDGVGGSAEHRPRLCGNREAVGVDRRAQEIRLEVVELEQTGLGRQLDSALRVGRVVFVEPDDDAIAFLRHVSVDPSLIEPRVDDRDRSLEVGVRDGAALAALGAQRHLGAFGGAQAACGCRRDDDDGEDAEEESIHRSCTKTAT